MIIKNIFTKISVHVINIGNINFKLVVCSSTSGQVLSSAMIITVFTSAAPDPISHRDIITYSTTTSCYNML